MAEAKEVSNENKPVTVALKGGNNINSDNNDAKANVVVNDEEKGSNNNNNNTNKIVSKLEEEISKDLLSIKEINKKWEKNFGKNVKTPVVLPVIHVISPYSIDNYDVNKIWKNNIGKTIEYNISLVKKYNFTGVFLINHGFSCPQLVDICKKVRKKYPKLWFGVNFLGCPNRNGIQYLKQTKLNNIVNALWVDNSYISTNYDGKPYDRANLAKTVAKTIKKIKFKGLYFGGVDFKYQGQIRKGHNIDNYKNAIKTVAQFASKGFMEVVCTSGPGTGRAADLDKMKSFREGCQCKLAVASGVTPENVSSYKEFCDAILIATGISETFYKFSDQKMAKLAKVLGYQ